MSVYPYKFGTLFFNGLGTPYHIYVSQNKVHGLGDFHRHSMGQLSHLSTEDIFKVHHKSSPEGIYKAIKPLPKSLKQSISNSNMFEDFFLQNLIK